MSPEKSTDEDARLSAVLKGWRVTATLPPRFQEHVWRRLERQDQQPSVLALLQKLAVYWIGALLPRPALAVCYVALLLVFGADAGWMEARQGTARVIDELSLRYVHSVDPYQKIQ